MTIKVSFIYFWNRKSTNWSVVWFICASIIFSASLKSAIKLSSVMQWLMLLYINSEKRSRNSLIYLVYQSTVLLFYHLKVLLMSKVLLIWFFCDRLKYKSKFRICHVFINTSYTWMIYFLAEQLYLKVL